MTDDRNTIKQAALAQLPDSVPVTVVGASEGYAIVVGTNSRSRWLHSTTGQFQTFSTLDLAAQLLRKSGINKFNVLISGGTPL